MIMQNEKWLESDITPRMRVISDNDYSGDPDGLVQLAHLLLSQSVETTAIIGTHLRIGDPWNTSEDSVGDAVIAAEKIIELSKLRNPPKVLRGADLPLTDRKTPIASEGALEIIREAMRQDSTLPLYVLCGASLTEIASAWLLEPAIAERLTLIWIGGHEYDDLAAVPPDGTDIEYNLHIDVIAGQVVFNDSNLTIWQVPRDSYRSLNASRAELRERMFTAGDLGAYLYNRMGDMVALLSEYGYNGGETYILGDSPLVLLTALQSVFNPDPSSCESFIRNTPKILNSGLYEENHKGRPIRVFRRLDNRMCLEDLYTKLGMHGRYKSED
jgi:purine nucleosidase